ncbi:hypothetical protein RRG08_038230 [Elysia crispata]|uniref:Uncharacterized protein n=1 Tax=Elysia crispata TaxID=231223 RepID=A0AAE1E1E7_9GAST|nr:hypothetical protein RRG08_038230 [Elysia crispata]
MDPSCPHSTLPLTLRLEPSPHPPRLEVTRGQQSCSVSRSGWSITGARLVDVEVSQLHPALTLLALQWKEAKHNFNEETLGVAVEFHYRLVP